jgi:hypothetical protein
VNNRYIWLLAAALLWTGCGKQEKQEATTLCNVLTQKQADFTATNALEKDLLGSTREWAEGIINRGAGHGKDLTENATSAQELSKSAATVSVQLGQLRQALSDQQLHEEYPQTVRGDLVKELMRRQRMLQDVRTALDASAASFLEFSQSRAYTGDTYPSGIDKLNAMLGSYKGADDIVAKAITDLKSKYQI